MAALNRRELLAAAPAGIFAWRWHMLARHECASGGVLALILRGEPWKLTLREHELVDLIASEMHKLEPAVLQQKS